MPGRLRQRRRNRTWCIAEGCALLHSDRDFDPMVQHLGLRAL
jgi:hypothetical protein